MNAPPFAYSVYGLNVHSNRSIPGLRPAGAKAGPLLTIEFEKVARCPAPSMPPQTITGCETFWRLSPNIWLLRYEDETSGAAWEIEVSEGGAQLTVRWTSSYQIDDIPSLLLGPGLAAALHLRKAFVLHASAVKVGGVAVLILGASGAGKSTTAAALVRRGFPLISDDVAVLESRGMVHAVHMGHSFLRLYENSAIAAGWPNGLPRLFHHPIFDEKRYVDLADETWDSESTPVQAIYVLQRDIARRSGNTIQPLTRRRGLQYVLANVYCNRFLDDAGRGESLRKAIALVNSVAIRIIHVPSDLAEIGSLADLLIQDAIAARCAGST